jgi:alpha-glucosidase
VEAQEGDPDSMLTLYRSALHLRRSLPALGAGSGADARWLDLGEDVVAFAREPAFTFVLNLGPGPVELPQGRMLVASGPLDDGLLPTDTAVWLATG